MTKVIAIDTKKLLQNSECRRITNSKIAEFILCAINEFQLPIVTKRTRSRGNVFNNSAMDYLYKTIYILITDILPCDIIYELDSITVSKFYIHIILKERKNEKRLY